MLTVGIKYIPSSEMSKHIKQNLTKLKRHIDGFTIIHGGFETSSSEMDQAIRTLKSSIDLQHINNSTNYSDQRHIHKNNFNVHNVYFFKWPRYIYQSWFCAGS